jgi:hypothetical protein
VAEFPSVTSAPGTTASLGSTTVPRNDVVDVCAQLNPAPNKRARMIDPMDRLFLIMPSSPREPQSVTDVTLEKHPRLIVKCNQGCQGLNVASPLQKPHEKSRFSNVTDVTTT